MDSDTEVKLAIYSHIEQTSRVPEASEIAQHLNRTTAQIRKSFARLADKRLLVLDPGSPNEIRMAPPFSAIETPFPVVVGDKRYYANCVWDALGIPAALHSDATIEGSDAYNADPIEVRVVDGEVHCEAGIAHFAVPAALWWEDIVHT
jgi:hypothetical protein